MAIFIPIHIHPLVGATFALMAGIVGSTGIYWISTILLIALTLGLLTCTTKNVLGTFFSFGLGLASGFWNFSDQRPFNYSAGSYRVIGIVEQIVERYTFAPQQELTVNQDGRTIQIKLDTPAPVLIGDTIAVEQIRPAIGFSSKVSPIKRTKILPKFKAKRVHVTLINRPQWYVARDIDEIHTDLVSRIEKKLGPDAFRLFCLMFLGKFQDARSFAQNEEKPFIEKLQSPAFQSRQWFNNWGISHYLARSGLHLVIVVILLQFLLGFIPIPYRGKRVVLGFYLVLYSLISWSAISFTRALLMVALAIGADFVHRPTQALHLITVATYVVLLFQPANLFYADLQLSFGLTFALAWANHVHRQRKLLHEWQTIASG